MCGPHQSYELVPTSGARLGCLEYPEYLKELCGDRKYSAGFETLTNIGLLLFKIHRKAR